MVGKVDRDAAGKVGAAGAGRDECGLGRDAQIAKNKNNMIEPQARSDGPRVAEASRRLPLLGARLLLPDRMKMLALAVTGKNSHLTSSGLATSFPGETSRCVRSRGPETHNRTETNARQARPWGIRRELHEWI